MSDNPTRSFKDFIGWAFVAMAGIVVALVSMIYSSLHADVAGLDARDRAQAERLKGAEERVDGLREQLREVHKDVKEINRKLDEWRLR